MTQWLAWRTALSPQAAREHVRVGRALEALPIVTGEFSAGRLSYSQVRALTRVAVPSTEAELVVLARSMTASQLDRLAACYRGVRAATTDTAQARRARRGLTSYLDDDGTRVIIARLPPEDGDRVVQVIEAAATDAYRARRRAPASPEAGVDAESDESVPALRADALVELIDRAARAEPKTGGDPDRALLVVHVGAEVLAHDDPDGACHLEQSAAIAPETARRLGCDAATVTLTEHPDGTTRLGRRSRRIPPALRRAVALRDHTCLFPGCESVLSNQHHHVRHWTRGGPTTLSNIATLCSFHHHRLHEGGYMMRARPGRDQAWDFLRPDGQLIPDVWPTPETSHADPTGGITGVEIESDACVPDWDGTRLDCNWIIDSLLQLEGLYPTPPPAPPVDGDDPLEDWRVYIGEDDEP